ncbi:MAG: molybdopterin cofactor-binding domain-containing protein [Candidatus Neomarinimicrobiota bacterium]|jgi:CO/xanthine dehydrogenase Mo-binding subunit|nr:molybdopterin-dependent oxidoreductase [Candidatus Neomarinimicrobiota bacterium]MDX9779993.1 molybdopterin-dependent oxidoreductase [bacterium]
MSKTYTSIGKAEKKIDALALATGSRRFVDDFELKDCLHCKLIYSPHAFADIIKIDESPALAMDGVVDVLSYKNTPQILHTSAGQGFPEPSPYDQYLFDKVVRFAGDRVAMVVAESPAIAETAAKKVKIAYKLRKALFDPERAMDADAPKLHGKECYTPIGAAYDPQRNLAAEVDLGFGDLKEGEEAADIVIDETYKAHYGSHCAIEPHSVKTYFDDEGRLVILASTQVPFHVRRIVARVCEFPLAKIRVIKPRIGGGFGGKQEVLLEPLAALVSIRHKRPARLVLSREEVFRNSRTRHPVRVRLRSGVKKDGTITFLEMDSLLNSGAYGSHALTVLSNCGSKVLPLLNKIENMHFLGRSVYTNLPVGGAYRGYGATQGYFALNQHLDILCRRLDIDLPEYIKKHHIREGETSKIFEALGEGKTGVQQFVNSCKLDECIDICTREIGWYGKRDKKIRSGDKVRGVGLAVAMQGSGIPLVDMAAASMKMNEDGSFNLDIGATDIGTGSDTVLAQIAAEVLNVDLDAMIVLSSDTDRTPFDVGAYASSTTYISGRAVRKCAEKILEQIIGVAAEMLETSSDKLKLSHAGVKDPASGKRIGYPEICQYAMYSANQFQIQAVASEFVEESPPPFIAQAVEVEVDTVTGAVQVLKLVSAVDCGQAINPKLAEGQIEGAAVNGISYAMTEEYIFSGNGRMINSSFKNYKIPTAADLPEMKTVVVPSHEPSGPFGAKSVGEIGINCPMPAIANAIYDAVGVRLYEAPFTPEKVYRAIRKQQEVQ